jgi:acetyltransferase-like isoleucine patch superfamily enzyme
MFPSFSQLISRFRWEKNSDRIGPDLFFTHWRLYFKDSMLHLCKKKFKKFAGSAEFRPGAYAVGCSRIEIGERVIIRPSTKLFGESEVLQTSITIEDDVLIGCGVHIYINNHSFYDFTLPIIDQGYTPDKQVILRRGCWIGANAIILPGVEIGENTVVGAGSVVTKSVPDRVVVAGVPAKIINNLGL